MDHSHKSEAWILASMQFCDIAYGGGRELYVLEMGSWIEWWKLKIPLEAIDLRAGVER